MKPILPTLLLLGLSACARPEPGPIAACPMAGQTAQLQITLLFGLTGPEGREHGVVSEAQWRDFVDREVTPRFPDGLTEIDTSGQWRNRVSNRITRQPSRVLLLVARASADLPARVESIRSLYRQRFSQQSVGVETQPVCAGF